MSQINDKFKEKRSNVTINFEPLGQGATWTNAQMARIAGQTTDVTATYGFSPADIINFQPDTQFLDLSGLPSLKNFDQTNVARFMTWKGKVWQMTLSYVGHVVWANEDMLAKYNLSHPKTYAEWQSMCETLKAKNEMPIFYAAKPQGPLNRMASMAEMTVGRPKHPNFWADMLVQGKADFTTPEWIESFKRRRSSPPSTSTPASAASTTRPAPASSPPASMRCGRRAPSPAATSWPRSRPSRNSARSLRRFPTTRRPTPSSRCTATSGGPA